jgi:hypothetical protein
MKWVKMEDLPSDWTEAYQGTLDGEPGTSFWLWKMKGQWYVSCVPLQVIGRVLLRGAEDFELAQKKAVRFFELIALERASTFLKLAQALGALDAV